MASFLWALFACDHSEGDPAPADDESAATDTADTATSCDSAEEEVCNDLDDDCDGEADEDATDASTWYRDSDDDGYGEGGGTTACDAPKGSVATEDGDCDDEDPGVNPGVAEDACDGIDADCGGESEPDQDEDGARACAGDCDDTDASIFPGAEEGCNGIDDDCDGEIPAEEDDVDGDGWMACENDCDDASADTSPAAAEVCDGIDGDCDGNIDADCVWCDLSVPADHATVQAAIDAAATGQIVCVSAGTWVENLDFGGAEITLLGVGGRDATQLDGGGLGSVVVFASGEGAGTVFSGFTVRNGVHSTGGGIRVESASPTLVDLVVSENTAPYPDYPGQGGGIYVVDGDPEIRDVVVRDNDANTYYAEGYYAGEGGGIYLEGSAAVLEDIVIEGNSAGSRGGGLFIDDGNPILVRTAILGNESMSIGGGGVYLSGATVDFDHVIIADNASGACHCGFGNVSSAGLAIDGRSFVTLSHVVIAENATEYGDGGGLGVWEQPIVVVAHSIVAGNTAAGDGDGVHVSGDATVAFASCDVWDEVEGIDDPAGVDGNVSVDPDFYDTDTHLAITSPLIDVGTDTDPDGSPGDLGIFGGDGADAWDLDGDGWPRWWLPGAYDAATSPDADCDDDDAHVYPGRGC